MSKARGRICDYAGEEILPGDLVAYAVRTGNRVRMSDAVVVKLTSAVVGGRVVPLLKVRPTGVESGFVKRRSPRVVTISAEHARVVVPAYEDES
ncbi:hypothetical protein ACWDRR_00730 [Kitasatospora sp. NPDC003701]